MESCRLVNETYLVFVCSFLSRANVPNTGQKETEDELCIVHFGRVTEWRANLYSLVAVFVARLYFSRWARFCTHDLWLLLSSSLVVIYRRWATKRELLAGHHPFEGGWSPPSKREEEGGLGPAPPMSSNHRPRRRRNIKRGGSVARSSHYSFYKCARWVRLVRVVDASEPPGE